jgi:hypothetical protein
MDYFPTAPLSDSSKALFNTNIGRWLRAFPPEKERTLGWLVRHPKKAMKCLRQTDTVKNTPKNHHCFLSAVVAYVRHEVKDNDMIMTWVKIRNENAAPIREEADSGEPTKLQKGKEMPWADILKVRDALPLSATKLLLAMYTYIPPIRADLFACRLYEETPDEVGEDNYIVLDEKNPRLVLQDYKTKKTYGTIQIPLPKPLYEMIRQCIKEGICGGNYYLFTDTSDLPYDRHGFSRQTGRMLTRAFGKPMTLTAIRHNFSSSIDNNLPVRKLKLISDSMAHSVGQQKLYKWDETADRNEIVTPE